MRYIPLPFDGDPCLLLFWQNEHDMDESEKTSGKAIENKWEYNCLWEGKDTTEREKLSGYMYLMYLNVLHFS